MAVQDEELRSVAELTNQATLLRRAGRTEEAVAAFREALERADENGEPMLRAMVRVNAGTAFGDVGDPGAATRAYEEALAILGPDAEPSPVLLLGTTNLGGARLAAGDLDAAQRHLTEALRLAGELGERAQQGVAIGHLGRVALARGELANAIGHFEAAIAVADDERDLFSLQQFQCDLATAYSWHGLHREALGAFSVARDIAVAADDPRAEAVCLHGLGVNQLLDGDERAHATLEAAMSAFLRTGERAAALDAALTLARAWTGHAAGLGDRGLIDPFLRDGVLPDGAAVVDTAALATARQWLAAAAEMAGSAGAEPPAAALARHHLLRLEGDPQGAARVLREAIVATSDDTARAGLEHALGALLLGPLGDAATAATHLRRALDLRRDPAATPDTGGLLAEQLRDGVAGLAVRAAVALAAAGDLGAAFAITEELRAPDGAGPVQDDVAGVVAALATRPGTALVTFLAGADTTLALLFLPGAAEPELCTLPLGSAAIAGRLWRPLAAARGDVVAGGDRGAWEETAGRVLEATGRRLLAPVADRLAGHDVDHLVLVPHGLLHLLPLHAAPVTAEGGTWLDAHPVSYASSATDAARRWRASPRPSPEQPQQPVLAAVGDPTGDLPLARVEAARAVARATRPGPLLLGEGTARETLAGVLAPGRWVHWAGHVQHVLDDPGSSGLLHGTPADGEAKLLPLPSAGDVLAGSTVVLSACETGAVTPHPPDAATGPGGVLLAAGATAAVTTCWEVGDACAILVMDAFYEALAAGATVPAALRSAQLAVRELGEDAVHDRLAAALSASPVDAGTSRVVLEPYGSRRPGVRPFGHPEAWGAFLVSGHTPAPPPT